MIDDIPEAKIRNAIWYLKTGKTKKFVCDFLGITYNTKKLDNIISSFREEQSRTEVLKEKNKKKVFSTLEISFMVKSYIEGQSLSSLAEEYHISTYRVKKLLTDAQVPIRSRSSTKVEHIVDDTSKQVNKGQKIYMPNKECYAVVDTVYNEDYLYVLDRAATIKVDTYPFTAKSRFKQPQQGIHYEYYKELRDGSIMKFSAWKDLRDSILKSLEEYGKEYYRVWRIDDEKCFYYAKRDEILPIKG